MGDILSGGWAAADGISKVAGFQQLSFDLHLLFGFVIVFFLSFFLSFFFSPKVLEIDKILNVLRTFY